MEAVPQLPMIRKIRLDDAYGSADPLVMVNRHRAEEMRCRQSDRVQQSRLNAFAALLYSGVRHAHRYEIALRAAGVHIHFHIDQVRVDPLNSGAKGAEQSHTELVAPRGVPSQSDPGNSATAGRTLLPILPLAISNHVKAQKQVGDGVHQDTVAHRFRTNHPEVIDDPGDKADVPIGSML